MGNSFRDEGWLTTRVSPVGWKCLPFCIRGRRVGGSNRRGKAQVGEKAEEKHLMRRGIGIGLQITEVRSRDGYLQWLGRGHH
jgi:hypothetical protein